MKTYLSLLIGFCLISTSGISQALLQSYNFDTGLGLWTVDDLMTDGDWVWVEDGKADNAPYWEEREAIVSESQGGAVVFNAAGINGPDNAGNIISGTLQSPSLNFSMESTVFLKFNQYYRNFDSNTELQFSTDGGTNWDTFQQLNLNVDKNVETGRADYQKIDLTSVAAGEESFAIRFVFSGDYYFWIIDDVEFYDGMPFPETFPEYVGDSLQNFGYPYEVDDSGWPYVPEQMVVQFKQDTPEPERAAIRDTFGAVLADSCACDRLELWLMGDDLIVGGDTLSGDGGSIGIQERIIGARAKSKIDGVDFNRYNYNQMKDALDDPNIAHTFNTIGTDNAPEDITKVAILDTGIDLQHDSLRSIICRNNEESMEANGIDEDGNCLIDDFYGWNFVNGNNNPTDDHSHGTHVAGIIRQNMKDHDPGCDYRIIPYKTHDYHGVGTLFDVTCGTYQALDDGASVINDSWGFYGNPSVILSNATDTAKTFNVLIITAAGNDTIDLSTLPQYPACYSKLNIITVGAYGFDLSGTINYADFSNYDPQCVDISANGVDVFSTIPFNDIGSKSGTSMAAPAVSAAAVMVYCFDPDKPYWQVRENILECATELPALNNFVNQGRILEYDYPCLIPVAEIGQQDKYFSVYPNPVNEQLNIEALSNSNQSVLQLHSLSGALILKRPVNQWLSGETSTIDMVNLVSGIYFLTIQTNDFIQTFKLVKI